VAEAAVPWGSAVAEDWEVLTACAFCSSVMMLAGCSAFSVAAGVTALWGSVEVPDWAAGASPVVVAGGGVFIGALSNRLLVLCFAAP